MISEELTTSIEKLKTPKPLDGDEREDILLELLQTKNPEVVSAMLEALDASGEELTESESSTLVFALIREAPDSLDPVIDYVNRSAASIIGRDCIYILGEIAYYQAQYSEYRIQYSQERDPRIIPTLVDCAHAAFEKGNFEVLGTAIHSLRECSRSTPILEVDALLWRTLSLISHKKIYTELNSRGVMNDYCLLEVLHTNSGNKKLFFSRLQTVFESLRSESELADCLHEFITLKGTNEEWW